MAAILEDERGLMPPEAEQDVEAAFRAALENEGVQNACATVMTVDNEEIMRKLIDIGADMLITNVPDVARRIVDAG